MEIRCLSRRRIPAFDRDQHAAQVVQSLQDAHQGGLILKYARKDQAGD